MEDKLIVIKELTKVFQTRPPLYALNGVELTVNRGEVFGIIGMSGAGKTTLIRCLTSLEKPTRGTIKLAGTEITALSPAKLRKERKKMGIIFQHFNLFSSKSVFENVAFPLGIEGIASEKRVKELLELVGLGGKQHLYPSQLSGGEKQRVGIARALANHPAILLCDEATSALDPQTTSAILELLIQLNRDLGLTILLITHEMEVIRQICTHVAVLEHGEVVEQGRVADLFAAPKQRTTQRFLQHLVHEVPKQLYVTEEGKEFLRLCFRGKGAEQPLISQMIKRCSVEVNILLGGIDVLRSETIGNLVIELAGTGEERTKARLFLQEHHVLVEEVFL